MRRVYLIAVLWRFSLSAAPTGAIQCAYSKAQPRAPCRPGRRTTMKAPLLLLVLIAAGASASAAQVYSWTDANGTKHFSDSPPPPSVSAQKIKVRSQLTTDAGVQPATEPATTQEPKPPEAAPTGATASAKPLVDS